MTASPSRCENSPQAPEIIVKKFNDSYQEILKESSISRILQWISEYECAAISASRSQLCNIKNEDKTLIDIKIGDHYTHEQNISRNSKLKCLLLKYGYGVTSLIGRHAEGSTTFHGKATSYFAVNINDDPRFYNNLFKLSEYFNQDSFLFKPKDSLRAALIGTNGLPGDISLNNPGYGGQIDVGEFHPNGFEGVLSQIHSKVVQFRLNENKNHNRVFIGENILSEESFNKLSITQKSGCLNTVKNTHI